VILLTITTLEYKISLARPQQGKLAQMASLLRERR
jgi:hypothetical protein